MEFIQASHDDESSRESMARRCGFERMPMMDQINAWSLNHKKNGQVLGRNGLSRNKTDFKTLGTLSKG